MKKFILAYDIFNRKRLYKVRKIAYTYSLGGQKSALEIPFDKDMVKSFITEIKPIIKDEDKLNIIKTFDKPILLGRASQILYENNGVIILWNLQLLIKKISH